jgi:hypothetical protein
VEHYWTFIHSFTLGIFNEHLLCARHCRCPSFRNVFKAPFFLKCIKSYLKRMSFQYNSIGQHILKSLFCAKCWVYSKSDGHNSCPQKALPSREDRQLWTNISCLGKCMYLHTQLPPFSFLIISFILAALSALDPLSYCPSYWQQSDLPRGHDPDSHTGHWPCLPLGLVNLWAVFWVIQGSSTWLWWPSQPTYFHSMHPRAAYKTV